MQQGLGRQAQLERLAAGIDLTRWAGLIVLAAVVGISYFVAARQSLALLTKPERRKVELPIKFVGFEIPDRFAIGYGLDFAERYRNLPYVAALTGVEP